MLLYGVIPCNSRDSSTFPLASPCFPTRHWPQSGKPPRQQQKRASSKQPSATCQIFRDFFVCLDSNAQVLATSEKRKRNLRIFRNKGHFKHKPEVRIGQHHLAEMSAEMFSSELSPASYLSISTFPALLGGDFLEINCATFVANMARKAWKHGSGMEGMSLAWEVLLLCYATRQQKKKLQRWNCFLFSISLLARFVHLEP